MEKSEKFKRTFERFEKAFNKFREITESPQLFDFLSHELIVEVTTKRFEYTFESLWKTLKEHYRVQGVDCATPLLCFKQAFKAGLVDEKDEALFLAMIEKRNQIVYIYDADQASQVYKFITKARLLSILKDIYCKLKQ